MAPWFSRLKLGAKFFLIMAALVFGIIGAVVYFVYVQQAQLIRAEVQARAYDLTTVLAFAAVRPYLEGNNLELQELIDNIKGRDDVRQAMLLDLKGKVLMHNHGALVDKIYDDELTKNMLRSDDLFFTVYRKLQPENENVVDVAAQVTVSNKKVAVARVIISLQSAEHAIQSMAGRILTLGGISLMVALALVALFSRFVTQPLRRLDEKALQISRGERDIQIEVTTQDEIGHLQQALKTMVEDVRLQSRLSALGATTANLAHEIRTPLINITRHANELIGPAVITEAGNRLLSEINQLNDLVTRLLQFSQKNKLALGRAEINELLKQALFLLSEPLQKKNINVKHDFQPLPLIAVDKNLLQSVFSNLIINAIQAMNAQGELSIETKLLQKPQEMPPHKTARQRFTALEGTDDQRPLSFLQKLKSAILVGPTTRTQHLMLAKLPREKQAIMVTFRDNGCGIPKELQEQLFLPFVTTKKDGNGLGLALSHKIIQEHQGSITVESKAGFGTTFTILLPV